MLITKSRLVLYSIPRRSPPCQANCAACDCARNGPNNHVYAWSVQSSYAWVWEHPSGGRGRHRVVLCTVAYRLEYVKTFSNSIVYFPHITAVALLTQAFYCYRTAILTKSKYAVALIIMVRNRVLAARWFCWDLIEYNYSFLSRRWGQLPQWRCKRGRRNFLLVYWGPRYPWSPSAYALLSFLESSPSMLNLTSIYRSGERVVLAATQRSQSLWCTMCVNN